MNCGFGDFGDFEGTPNTVRLFPTYAVLSPAGDRVRIPIRVWVHERQQDRLRRKAIEVLRKQLDIVEGSPEHAIFERRMVDLMVDNESGELVYAKVVGAGLAPTELKVGKTSGDGHVDAVLEVPLQPGSKPPQKLALHVRLQDAYGTKSIDVPLVPAKGLTVISDIDDTIKITNVVDKREMFANTMLREFRAAPGMAPRFATWAEQGATFHYVSASPWALQAELAKFATDAGFPSGVYHLRTLRLKDLSSTYDFAQSSEPHKNASIETLLTQFPERTFILVGDTGEKDPEIYAGFAKRFPDRINHIYLRQVPGADNTPGRFATTFAGVPATRWTLLADPAEPPTSGTTAAAACTNDAECTITATADSCCPACAPRPITKVAHAQLEARCADPEVRCVKRHCPAPQSVRSACSNGACVLVPVAPPSP